jgi:hypothetical protein
MRYSTDERVAVNVPEPALYFAGTVALLTVFLAAKVALGRRFPKLARALSGALENPNARLEDLLRQLALDPALKAKRAKHGGLLLRFTSPSGAPIGEAVSVAGDPAAPFTTVELLCASAARVDDALRGRADLWRVWATRDLVLRGDTAACLVVTEALFRLAARPASTAGGR